jgi:hypothetical protein
MFQADTSFEIALLVSILFLPFALVATAKLVIVLSTAQNHRFCHLAHASGWASIPLLASSLSRI